jgi:alkylhydroperoxidase family enzyme
MAETLFTRTPRDKLPEKFHLAWDTLNGLTGEPAFVEVFASNPEMLEFVMNQFYMGVFFGGKVDQRYKQLVRLKLSLLHGCRTCNKQNVPGALAAGITQAQVDAMDDFEHGPFTDAEKAVIAYADEVALTNTEGRMTPELFKRLRAHFSEADILELGVTMAIISGMAKLSFVIDVVEKESYCPFAATAAA